MSGVKRTAYIGKDCVACGSCVKICPRSALSIHRGLYAVVEESRCVGCGKCVVECPAGVIEMAAKEAKTA